MILHAHSLIQKCDIINYSFSNIIFVYIYTIYKVSVYASVCVCVCICVCVEEDTAGALSAMLVSYVQPRSPTW